MNILVQYHYKRSNVAKCDVPCTCSSECYVNLLTFALSTKLYMYLKYNPSKLFILMLCCPLLDTLVGVLLLNQQGLLFFRYTLTLRILRNRCAPKIFPNKIKIRHFTHFFFHNIVFLKRRKVSFLN